MNGFWLTGSSASGPDAAACTLFLIATFTLAGLVQTAWLKSRISNRFALPLDCGATLRSRRIFGANKTWRGLVVMVPAVGASFWALAVGMELLRPGSRENLWSLTPAGYFVLGCWGGLGFMLGELPNSFIKRQLDVSPGKPPANPVGRIVCFLIDQIDSVLGALVALSLIVKIPWPAWVGILLAGPLVHWLFNVLLMLLGVKAKAA